ncbi:cytidine deaminase [Bifidobacterium sp. ESL0769]|uniref:cytidine deaminase n=1 Tax=Bifidobacterium sp. ESL0769 TaxID=2983229 RepID=UPI0023F9B38B|nr:cytidine deaminase [Bifidobacterium sp. ESL0769]WEV68142.1 cytidine deaminase [Bifidobacterium sp. ESL0769]
MADQKIDKKQLIEKAFDVQQRAYTPYSHFRVGAALLCADGKIYQGCNIENAGLTATNCAERTAFFKAISEGERKFTAIAIVGNPEGVEATERTYCSPCGVCRQVMAEFCDLKTFDIIMAKSADDYIENTLDEVLPLAFTGANLD